MSYKLLTNLLFEPRGKHNPSLTYNIKDTVMSEDGSKVYFALDNVPAGIPLTDTNYWMLQMDLSASKNAMDAAAANARTQTDATIASANTRVEDMMSKTAEAVTSVADYAAKVGMRVKGETKITKGNPMMIYPDGGSLLKVQTDIPIKQLGSGDPYPAGDSKNLLDASNVSHKNKAEGESIDNGKRIKVTTNIVTTLAYIRYVCAENPAPGMIFTVSVKSMTASANNKPQLRFIFSVDGTSVISNKLDNSGTNTITIPEYTGEGSLRVNLYSNVDTEAAAGDYAIFEEVQVEVGATATAWQPYSNIRPFVGYDELGLSVAGKNLVPTHKRFPAISSGITVSESDGVLTVSGTTNTTTRIDSDVIILPPGTYTLKPNHSATLTASIYMRRLDASKFGSVSLANNIEAKSTFTITEPEKVTVSLFFEKGAVANNVTFAVMLNVGSEPYAFEPYKGSIHTVQLDKTTYQGHYDWLTGKFRAEWAMKTLDGTENWVSTGWTNPYTYAWWGALPDAVAYEQEDVAELYCSHYTAKSVKQVYYDETPGVVLYAGNGSLVISSPTHKTLDAFKAALVASPVQIAYKLATPIEIQLAPNVITAVEDGGVNHIYGDADLTVEWVKPLETSLTEHSNAKVDANNEALLMDVAQKERSIGNPVVINDAVANVAFPHVETVFMPKQSGSGDPYPAGAGKNMFDLSGSVSTPTSSTKIDITGETVRVYTTNNTTYASLIGPDVVLKAGTTYTISGNVTAINTKSSFMFLCVRHKSGNTILAGASVSIADGVGFYQKSFTVDEDREAYVSIIFTGKSAESGDITMSNIQLEVGSTTTPYAPYSNIRPITGYDAVELNHAGKNLLEATASNDVMNGVTKTINTDGSITLAGTCTAIFGAVINDDLILPDGNYKLVGGTNSYGLQIWGKDSSGAVSFIAVSNGSAAAFTADHTKYASYWIHYEVADGKECNDTLYPAIFLESDADVSFAPYQGTLHTVQLGETIYGGRYNWLTGKLVAEWARVEVNTINALDTWGLLGATNAIIPDSVLITSGYQVPELLCDRLKKESLEETRKYNGNFITQYMSQLYIRVSSCDTLEKYQEWIKNNPFYAFYKLSIPIEIQLDPTRITTIPGTNTIFGDGEFTIDWFKSYKKVAEERENLLLDSFTDKAELSGNPIVMTPVGGIPFDSVVTEFSLKQSGSGDPYPAGGGGNLLPPVVAKSETNDGVTFASDGKGTYTIKGESGANGSAVNWDMVEPFSVGEGESIYWHLLNSTIDENIVLSFYNGSTKLDSIDLPQINYVRASNGLAEKTITRIRIYVSPNRTYNAVISPMGRRDANPVPFTPYSNIRPITGYDKLDLNHAGKNLFTGWIRGERIDGTTGAFYVLATGARTRYIPVKPSKQMQVIGLTVTMNNFIAFYDAEKNFIDRTSAYGSEHRTINVPENCHYIAITQYEYSGMSGVIADLSDAVQLEFGASIPTEHTVPTGIEEHTVQIGQTVYGGRFDWLTGKLVAEWASSTVSEMDLNARADNFVLMSKTFAGAKSETLVVCDTFPSKPYDYTNFAGFACIHTDGRLFVGLPYDLIGSSIDATDLNSAANKWLTAHPLQVAYKLATPIEIQLTPTEIIALTGTNTLYGDGNTITAKFRQSKTISLEERLSALEAVFLNQ